MSTREAHFRHAMTDRPSFDRATVAQAMHHGILSCPPDATIPEIAAMMVTHHVHAVLVDGVRVDAHGEHLVWGIVSDLDLVGSAGADGSATAGRLAATPAITVAPEDPLTEAARTMRESDVHHLVVVDARTDRPIGIVSTMNVANVLAFGGVGA
jgi:CBS domain-containing protein